MTLLEGQTPVGHRCSRRLAAVSLIWLQRHGIIPKDKLSLQRWSSVRQGFDPMAHEHGHWCRKVQVPEKGGNVVQEFCTFSLGTAILAMMKVHFKKSIFVKEMHKWNGEPHKRSSWIFNSEVFVGSKAKFDQVTCYLI